MKKLLFMLTFGIVTLTMTAQINVTGIVTDKSNEPMVGIGVSIENSTQGTITDLDGKYSITVPNSQSVLVYSFIGYKKQRMTVGNNTVINIVLQEDAEVLDEVVVVGYGTQKKVNVTGAVSSINFEDQAMSRPITSVSASLAGLTAGLSVGQGSGQPGSDGATLRVRGVGTLNDNNPLVLIDGMIGSIDDVNPNDIASISILKDGASTAIYGARAGSGVILITTKNGNKGKTTVTYSGRLSIMNAVNLPKTVNNYADFMEYTNEANWQAGGTGATFDPITDIQLWRDKAKDPNGLNEYGYPNYVAYPNTNSMEEVYNKNSIKQEHNVSITGGSEKSRYLMSLGYVDNPGIVDYSGMERFNMRINIESDVTKWLTVGARVYGNKDRLGVLDFDGEGDYAISKWLMSAIPGIYPYYDGKYGGVESTNEYQSSTNARQRLDGYANGRKDRSRINSTVYAKFRIIEGLTYDVNLNYDRLWQETNSWGNPKTGLTYSFSRGRELSPMTSNDQLTTSNDRYDVYSYTLEHLVNYSKTFARDHDVTALVGFQEYYWKEWKNGASRRGLIDESIHNLSSGTEVLTATGEVKDRASRAFFGRLTYAFKSRYLFEFNMRYDGHSRFHKDHRWGTFPSVSAGWRITEENFMENTRDWLDNLKLRVSWGKNGNYGGTSKDVGDYEYQGGYNPVLYPFGDSQYSGLVQKEIANSLLSWESTKTTNIGLEAAFLKNRLTFEFDAFQKNTDGILYQISIPITAGDKTAPRLNLAEMKNKGYEFTIGWRDNIGQFNYGISGNLSYSKNEVTKYKGTLKQGWGENEAGEPVWQTNLGDVSQGDRERVIEGRTMNEYFLRTVYKGNGSYNNADGSVNPNGGPRDGMIRTDADMEWVKAMVKAGYSFQGQTAIGQRNGLYYGDYIYADTNGDKVLGNDGDRSLMGSSSIPKYTYGFQLQAEWKGIDISMNFAGAGGFDLLMKKEGYNTTLFQFGKMLSEDIASNHYFYDPANPDDPRTNINAKYGRITQSTVNSTVNLWSDLHLYKGDYLKLKNLTIGYSLPKQWLNKIGLEKIRFYYSGENLFSIDSYPGVDPEQGADPKYQPIRQHAFGVNVTF